MHGTSDASTDEKFPFSIKPDGQANASLCNTETLAPLAALCAIARFHQVAADPATLAHQLALSASDPLTTSDVLRAAQHLGLKAKLSSTTIERLPLIVVRDLNSNGTIDSGRELFGDNTILQNGPNAGQTAANGFEALADLDMDANGVADGKFDSNDVAYASVKLWKDLNQDGISQTDELFTFEQLGVAGINVSGTASNVELGGGNTQTFSGSFPVPMGKPATAEPPNWRAACCWPTTTSTASSPTTRH